MKEILSQAEIQELLQPFLYKMRLDFNEASGQAIDAFYGDYNPKVYVRQGGLHYMWKMDEYAIPNGVSLVITYSSSLITGYHESVEMVFQGPFLQGYHGGPKYFRGHAAPKMSPSPWEMIQTYLEGYTL